MSFFKDSPRDCDGTDLAQILAKALNKARLLTHLPDIIAWGAELDKLKYPHARVVRLLEWYAARITQPYLPRAHTPRAFRLKFEELEAAMNATLSTMLKIAPEAQRVADRLTIEYDWPTEIESHLAAIVERSAIRFEDFAAKLRAYTPGIVRDLPFIEHVLQTHMHRGFIENLWLPYWHTRVGYHSNYTGSVQALEFDPVSEVFRDGFWRMWSNSWCRRPRAFDDLLASVLE